MRNKLDATLSALADPTRRRVVELLRNGPRRAGELADAVGTSAPVMSRHLRVLLESGVVEDERAAHDARLRIFRLRRHGFAALQVWTEQMQAFWNEQLTSFGCHVDRKRRR